MRKKTLPIGILVMLLVVLLAAVGISYGLWTDTLTADAHVTTGNMDVRWASLGTSASASGTGGDGSCSIGLDSSNDHNLIVTLSQIQPGFRCDFTAGVYNEGTVPAVITIDPTTDVSSVGTDDFDAGDFIMGITDCQAPTGIVVDDGAYGVCSGYLKLKNSADDTTQNMDAEYVITVHATQDGTIVEAYP
jgi:hypothetical protein